MTPYPLEIENLDRIRRKLLDGMNRIDRIRKKRMGEGRRQIETLLHFFHKSSCPSRSSCLLLFFSRLHAPKNSSWIVCISPPTSDRFMEAHPIVFDEWLPD